MKKIQIIFAVFFAALFCATSCGKDDDNNNNDPEQPTAKFLTVSEFASSNWAGTDSNGEVTLSVNSTTEMTLTYFVLNTLSKNTDDNKKTKTDVKITYTFDEVNGSFSGSDNSKNSYSGTLTSKTAMNLKMPSEQVELTRK